MKKYIEIKKNSYFDSVTLMSLSESLKNTQGVEAAVISMATDMNKELLKKAELYSDEVEGCTENDMVIAFSCQDETEKKTIMKLIEQKLKGEREEKNDKGHMVFKTVKQAKAAQQDANMAVISIPGDHAYREAMTALDQGMNVMIFSDNMPVEEEKKLKETAHRKELLVMGPDCGTAIINGTALCFANKVNRGNISIAGASGTGIQEVTVLISRYGGGIANAIGVGGRDLSKEIGGIMMTDALRMLQQDENTEVIVLLSKKPDEDVRRNIIKLIEEEIEKPVILCFMTETKTRTDNLQITIAENIQEAARLAVLTAGGKKAPIKEKEKTDDPVLQSSQKYIRGLYCGGTLCSEAYYYFKKMGCTVYSNVSKRKEEQLKDLFVSKEDTLLDLGDDFFTNGRPHPMMDPTLRNDRIIEECRDEHTAVVLLDFEIGYGSHQNPVGAAIDAIRQGQKNAREAGREICFVTYVCGTPMDEQNKEQQENMLKEQGCIVAGSNMEAVWTAYEIVKTHRQ